VVHFATPEFGAVWCEHQWNMNTLAVIGSESRFTEVAAGPGCGAPSGFFRPSLDRERECDQQQPDNREWRGNDSHSIRECCFDDLRLTCGEQEPSLAEIPSLSIGKHLSSFRWMAIGRFVFQNKPALHPHLEAFDAYLL
jgi:hypothetical protein